MKPIEGGGYGVLGRWTEGLFAITDEKKRDALKLEIITAARSSSFLWEAGFGIEENDRVPQQVPDWWFLRLVSLAEVVGSTRGGAAGYLRLEGEQRYKLRIAIIPEGGYRFWSRKTIIKHELGHFVREAKVRAHGRSWIWYLESRSLFRQERRPWCYLYNLLVVCPREEWLVWWFTMPNWKWRLGMVVSVGLAVLIGALWGVWWQLVDLAMAPGVAIALALMVWLLTLLAWRS